MVCSDTYHQYRYLLSVCSGNFLGGCPLRLHTIFTRTHRYCNTAHSGGILNVVRSIKVRRSGVAFGTGIAPLPDGSAEKHWKDVHASFDSGALLGSRESARASWRFPRDLTQTEIVLLFFTGCCPSFTRRAATTTCCERNVQEGLELREGNKGYHRPSRVSRHCSCPVCYCLLNR